jgi:glycosyltransferase involved in cell wall biosynthesis
MRIAVIVPHVYRGGTLRGAINIARMLKRGARAAGDLLEISFGHLDDSDVYRESDFNALRNDGIPVRPFKRQLVGDADLSWHLDAIGEAVEHRRSPWYLVFNDGAANFEDCDFWLIISDRISNPLPAHRRYAVVAYDYIQRYVPAVFGQTVESDAIWREFDQYALATRLADFVICTTEQTRRDCICYAGAEPKRVKLFPMEFDPFVIRDKSNDVSEANPYIVWTTNTTIHKNHETTISALEKYFADNPYSQFKIIVTGAQTDAFDEHGSLSRAYELEYVRYVRDLIRRTDQFRKRARFLGEVSDTTYKRILSGAVALLHSALYDNGTFSVIEAACAGVPAISSDYPAMKEIASRFRLPIVFFNPVDGTSLRIAIEECLNSADKLRQKLPSIHELSRHSFNELAPVYWRLFQSAYNEHSID